MKQSRTQEWRGGWVWLIVAAVSRGYLVLLLALAGCALIPSFFGLTGSVVQSGSMEPRISPGDVVLSKALPLTVPAPLGHVVSFPAPPGSAKPGMMLHRLVDVNDDGTFVTKGDANENADSTALERKNIVSQAGLLIPWIGLPSFWLLHGNITALSIWLVATTGVLVIVGIDRDSPVAVERQRNRERGKRSVRQARSVVAPAATVALILVAALAAPPIDQAQAAFSAQARSGGSGWGAAALFPAAHASDPYIVVAGSITNTSATIINGNVAVSPGTMTAFNPGKVTGTVDLNNAAAVAAAADVASMRNSLAARTPTATIAPTLSGTLTLGTYASTTGAFTVPGTLTLDGQGNAGAVFVIETSTTLSFGGTIVLAGGAQAKNVFWTVGGAVNLTAGTFRGTLLSAGSVGVTRGTTVYGRLFTGGTLTLDKINVYPIT